MLTPETILQRNSTFQSVQTLGGDKDARAWPCCCCLQNRSLSLTLQLLDHFHFYSHLHLTTGPAVVLKIYIAILIFNIAQSDFSDVTNGDKETRISFVPKLSLFWIHPIYWTMFCVKQWRVSRLQPFGFQNVGWWRPWPPSLPLLLESQRCWSPIWETLKLWRRRARRCWSRSPIRGETIDDDDEEGDVQVDVQGDVEAQVDLLPRGWTATNCSAKAKLSRCCFSLLRKKPSVLAA